MTTDKSYNGYTNYETWVVNMWLDNDQGMHDFWLENASAALENTEDQEGEFDVDQAVSDLEDRLKEEHEENLPEITGFAADLLNAAMSEVNWSEIVRSLVESAVEAVKS